MWRQLKITTGRVLTSVLMVGATLVALSPQASALPTISLSKDMPPSALLGAPIPVTLTATHASGPDGYNLTFSDLLPLGATFGSSDPPPSMEVTQPSGRVLVVWQNIADLAAGAEVELDYTFVAGAPEYSYGDPVTNDAAAYVHTDPIQVPEISDTNVPSNFTGSGAASDTSVLAPFRVRKTEPSEEGELLRGVHDNKTRFTLTVDNNVAGASTGFALVDHLPAGLEYLGCSAVDNSTAGTEEYPGKGRIDATPHPGFSNPCAEPSSVTTVTSDGTGSLPAGVYTRVEWDSAAIAAAVGSADLAAGGSFALDYAAAIPLRENVDDGGTATPPTANLDNNTGPLTQDEQALVNYVELSGTTGGVAYTSNATETVTAEDLKIRKTVSNPEFVQGQASTWTLEVESSEYATQTDGPVLVTDTLPDGLEFTSSNPAPSSGPTNGPNGTQIIGWALPALTAPNSTATITFVTNTLTEYRDTSAPVAANDEWINQVDVSTTITAVTAADGSTTAGIAVTDDSTATQRARGVEILKQVSTPPAGVLTCGDGTGVSFTSGSAGNYGPGDRVCWLIRASFQQNLDTLNPIIKDFLPDGVTFESQQFGAGHDLGTGITFDGSGTGQGALLWDLDNVDPSGQNFEVIVSSIIDPNAALDDLDELQNLLKLSYQNTDGSVFQARADAMALYAEPILALTKTPSPTTAAGGDTVTYTLLTENTGGLPTENTTFLDTLPVGVLCASLSNLPVGATCSDGSGPRSELTIPGVAVPAGGSTSVTYQVTLPDDFNPGTTLTNDAAVTSYQTATNTGAGPTTFTGGPTASTSITVAEPILAKTKTTDIVAVGNTINQATIGETINYVVTVTIPAGTTTTGGVLSDNMPGGVSVTAATPTLNGNPLPGTFTFTTDSDGFSLDLPDPYVVAAADGEQVISVALTSVMDDVATNIAGRNRRNRARFDWNGSERLSAATGTRIVEPAPEIVKSVDDADLAIDAGQDLEFTLDVSNTGSISHTTTVVDELPDALTPTDGLGGAPLADGAFTASGGEWDQSLRTLTWNLGDIDRNTTSSVNYFAQAASPLITGSVLVNTATVTATSLAGGAGRTGYTDTDEVRLNAPSPQVLKSVDPNPATVGDILEYTVVIQMPAGVVGFDTMLADQLPPGVAYRSLVSQQCLDPVDAPCTPDITLTDLNTAGDTGRIGFWAGDLEPSSATDRFVTLVYSGIVQDVPANVSAATLDNTAAFALNDTNVVAGNPATVPPATDFVLTSDPSVAQVTLIEPLLTVDKDVAGQTGDGDTRRAKPGDVLSFTVTIENTGTGPAHDVVVSDTPDARLISFANTTADAGVVISDADPSDGTLEWTIAGPIPATESRTITYELTVPTLTEADENPVGFELTNTTDVPAYFALPLATRTDPANADVTYRALGVGAYDVTPDTVSVELDLASIGDLVWYDINGDGIRDGGEPGIAGVDVSVTYLGIDGAIGGGDDEVFTAVTGADGTWSLSTLPGGNYVVDVDNSDVPAGLGPSFDLDDGTTAPDGDWAGTLAENDVKIDVDAGFSGAGSLGNLVWFDQDGDGTVNGSEAGLPGIDVIVVWSGPDGVATNADDVQYIATTDATGAWTVGNLPTGDYSVTLDPGSFPSGMAPISDPDAGAVDGAALYTLGAAEDVDTADFGLAGSGSIGDTIYLDRDGDGNQGAGEAGLESVTVALTYAGPDGTLGNADDQTYTTSTDASGNYSFANLPASSYAVAVTAGIPGGTANSEDPDGGGDSMATLPLADGENRTDQDFGYDVNAVLGDRVWWDLNRDGVQNVGEPGIPGVGIQATYLGPDGVVGGGNDQVFTATTSADGLWTIPEIPEGDYIITVTGGVPAGFAPTYDQDSGTTAPDETSTTTLALSDSDQDFGYAGTASAGDLVWLDLDSDGSQGAQEPGLGGVTVNLTWLGPDGVSGGGDDVVLTNSTATDGSYLFDGLPVGNYSIALDQSSFGAGIGSVSDPDGGAADGASTFALTAGQALDTVDFGLAGSGSIGDTIYLDRNGNGGQDFEDPGIQNVTMTLTYAGPDGVIGNADDQTFTTTTDANGGYLFVGLPPADYIIEVTGGLPTGAINSDDPDGGGDSISARTLGDAENDLDQDFGFDVDSTIGDLVWWDLNRDGAQDAGEPGLAGVTLEVTYLGPDGVAGGGNDQVFSATTDSAGLWNVIDIPEGNYTVEVISGVPAGFTATFDADSGTTSPDQISATTVATVDSSQDFGYAGTASLGDLVWFDQNGDSTQDASEPGLAAITIDLTWFGPDAVVGGGDDIVLTTTTDAVGDYNFEGLPAGEFSVAAIPASFPAGMASISDPDGGSADGTAPATLTDGAILDTVDFGLAGSGSIGDTIYLDQNGDGSQDGSEPGIENVTVTLTWYGPDGIAGGGDDEIYTTITDASGNYGFINLPPSGYTVDVTAGTPAGSINSGDPDTGGDSTSIVTLADGAAIVDQDFGYDVDSAIGDLVWWDLNRDGVQDLNEPGIGGVDLEVTWLGPDGVAGADDQLFTATTAADGTWSITEIPDGNYVVTVVAGVPAGFTATFDSDSGVVSPDETSATTLTAIASDQDFGYAGTASAGNRVWLDLNNDGVQDLDETGLPNVAVNLTWFGIDGIAGGGDDVVFATTTDAAGDYIFTGLPAGNYAVAVEQLTTPSGAVPSFDPDSGVVGPDGTTEFALADGEAKTDQDFGFTGSATVGDTVWLDVDGDGTRGPGEPGLEDATVTLTWFGADGIAGGTDDVVFTTGVADDGSYLFENLPAGQYSTTVSGIPADLSPTADPDGGNDGTSLFTLDPGAAIDTQDFGYTGTSALGNFVWLDLNSDDVQDPGEPGIAGVDLTVTVAGLDGVLGTPDDLIVTATTDTDGNYSVGNLPAGPFSVEFDPAALTNGLVPTGATSLTGALAADEINETLDFGLIGPGSISGSIIGGPAVFPGIPVTITMAGADGGEPIVFTTTIQPDGTWSISGLPLGDYTISVDPADLPAGYEALTPLNDQAELAVGTEDVQLVSMQIAQTGSIGDLIWLDADRDGVRDAGEPGISLVALDLLAPDGSVISSTITGAEGVYAFTGLVPGSYTVRVNVATIPTGQSMSVQSQTVTLEAGQVIDTVDFRTITPIPPPPLAVTGSETGPITLFGFIFLLLGLLLVLTERRPRQST